MKALLGPAAEQANICDYAFADIADDGFYRLLVSIDYSGRRWCNHLEVLSSDGAPAQELEVWNVEHVADILVTDGRIDTLRVPRAITDYEGSDCIAVVPIFYSFSKGKLTTAVVAEHSAYYEALRTKLRSSPSADVCEEVVADKVDRLLGDKTAGFSHAQVWMASNDPSLRRKAVRVFQDIGDTDSHAALLVLSEDRDPAVASEARSVLLRP